MMRANMIDWKKLKNDTTSIEELGLSVRSYNSLLRANMKTIGDIAQRVLEDGEDSLRKIRNLVLACVNEILKKCNEYYCRLFNAELHEDSFFEEIASKDSLNFIKDSTELAEIDKEVEEFLIKLTEKYLTLFSKEETEKHINELIDKYHAIIDLKRSTASIKGLISSRLKHKHNLDKAKKGTIHKHNMFVDDDLNPNI